MEDWCEIRGLYVPVLTAIFGLAMILAFVCGSCSANGSLDASRPSARDAEKPR